MPNLSHELGGRVGFTVIEVLAVCVCGTYVPCVRAKSAAGRRFSVARQPPRGREGYSNHPSVFGSVAVGREVCWGASMVRRVASQQKGGPAWTVLCAVRVGSHVRHRPQLKNPEQRLINRIIYHVFFFFCVFLFFVFNSSRPRAFVFFVAVYSGISGWGYSWLGVLV